MKQIRYIFHITGILGIGFLVMGLVNVFFLVHDFNIHLFIKTIIYFYFGVALEILNFKTGEKL